jgi:hypothetical protein
MHLRNVAVMEAGYVIREYDASIGRERDATLWSISVLSIHLDAYSQG